jgi:hypothetical protein
MVTVPLGVNAIASLGDARLSNYVFPEAANGAGEILPASLDVALANQTKVYDGTNEATFTSEAFTISGLVSGESLTVQVTSGAYNATNVPSATSVLVNLGESAFAPAANTLLANYVLPESVTAMASITPKSLSSTYIALENFFDGSTNANVSGSLNGLVAGDDVGLSELAAFENSWPGMDKRIDITSITLTGQDAVNYVLQSDALSIQGDHPFPNAVEMIQALTIESLAVLRSNDLAEIDPELLTLFTPGQFGGLPPETMAGLTEPQAEALANITQLVDAITVEQRDLLSAAVQLILFPPTNSVDKVSQQTEQELNDRVTQVDEPTASLDGELTGVLISTDSGEEAASLSGFLDAAMYPQTTPLSEPLDFDSNATLVSTRTLETTLDSTNPVNVALPVGTFRHTDPNEQLELVFSSVVETVTQKTQLSGLPDWVLFIPDGSGSGQFFVDAPFGFSGQVRITITAVDSNGNTAETTLTLNVSDGRSQSVAGTND